MTRRRDRDLQRVPSRAVFQAMRMFTSTMYDFWGFIEYTGDVHNLVVVVQREEGLLLQAAYARAAALHDDSGERN